jgi:hypothetical protein
MSAQDAPAECAYCHQRFVPTGPRLLLPVYRDPRLRRECPGSYTKGRLVPSNGQTRRSAPPTGSEPQP